MPAPQPAPTIVSRSRTHRLRCDACRGRTTRLLTTLAALTVALQILAACSVPGRNNESSTGGTPEATATIQATRAAQMPIVTATAVVAGSTETSGTPQPPSDIPATYVVQESDSLYAIALRFGVELNVLITTNGLADPNDIQVGQELIIPTPTP